MNNKAIAAIGTLALAAGIGLAACGGSGSSSTAPGPSAGHAPTTQPSRPVISPGNVPPFLTNGGPSENVEYTEADTQGSGVFPT
jgi:ABC-type glycerol-3-phosphate transport system substrate-binding protein